MLNYSLDKTNKVQEASKERLARFKEYKPANFNNNQIESTEEKDAQIDKK